MIGFAIIASTSKGSTAVTFSPMEDEDRFPEFDRVHVDEVGRVLCIMNADPIDPTTGLPENVWILGSYKGYEYVSHNDKEIVIQKTTK